MRNDLELVVSQDLKYSMNNEQFQFYFYIANVILTAYDLKRQGIWDICH